MHARKDTPPVKILMVEDDNGHARLIEKNLRRAGINNPLMHFESGDEFIDFFFDDVKIDLGEQPYAVFLDLNLPGTDGYEILRRIKNDSSRHKVPVIVLTTTSNPGEVDRCYELGCNMYITKPIDYDNFGDAMNKLALMLSIVKMPNG